jgi:hypothetical protein
MFYAHAAHWTNLILFVPVIAFMVWLAVTQIRDRRAARRSSGVADGDR